MIPAPARTENEGQLLVTLARAALAEAFGGVAAKIPDGAWLRAPGACFVTLTQDGALRGCVGSIEPRRALGEDVIANARAAAFRDPRFPDLTESELAGTRIAVTVLSPLEPLEARSEVDAVAALRPGVDGVVLTCGARRGVFIPHVWKELPSAASFLAHLKLKAGLPALGWNRETRLMRFTAQAWEEEP